MIEKFSTWSEHEQIHTIQLLKGDELPPSRAKFLRQIKKIGSNDNLFADQNRLQFVKLKRDKRTRMGPILRNQKSEVELFGLRDQNVQERLKIPAVDDEDNQIFSKVKLKGATEESDIIHFCSQVGQYAYLSKIECIKCQGIITKPPYIQSGNNLSGRALSLSTPSLIRFIPSPTNKIKQKVLKAHEPLKRQDLPPLVFQANVTAPPTDFVTTTTNFRKSKITFDGRKKRIGRIADGFSNERSEFTSNFQKQTLYESVEEKPFFYNLSVQRFNRKKTIGGGNVLGKAIQNLQKNINNNYIQPNNLDRSAVREKERQIDELIFGKRSKDNNILSEQQVDMKDFI